jgi:hypothetical protein
MQLSALHSGVIILCSYRDYDALTGVAECNFVVI